MANVLVSRLDGTQQLEIAPLGNSWRTPLGCPAVRWFTGIHKGIEYTRRLLGNTDITTTQRYLHLDETELRDAQDLIE